MRRLHAGLVGIFVALLLVLGANPAHAGVEDFTFESWDARYEISLDASGRAVAEVTETIVAKFPEYDQNRGIVRGLPLRFEGAPAAPENVSITDASGNSVPFELDDEDNFRVILVGDNSYVHGRQTYVISYTLPDPVLAASKTGVDEFYWDLLPIDRAQSVGRFSAEVVFAPELSDALTGAMSCYTGPEKSTTNCDITESGSTIRVPGMSVPPGSGVTIAVGLEPGSVTQPPERIPNFALDTLPMLLSGGSALAGAGSALAIARLKRKRRRYRGIIVAQYDVPDYLPPLIAGPIVGGVSGTIPAQFVHLAVNGVTRIEEAESTAPSQRKKKNKKPIIEFRLLDRERAADAVDRQTMDALFSDSLRGTVTAIPKNSEAFAKKMKRLEREGVAAVSRRGYVTKERSPLAVLLGFVALALVVPAALLIFQGAGRDIVLTGLVTLVLGAIGSIAWITSMPKHRVLTPLGAETREYLLGVKEFIRVAEADRMQMLQSYSGAERRADGEIDVIHIYERLLPYAILFGLQVDWSRVLEVRYQESSVSSPDWYPGVVLSNGGFSTSMASFTSSVRSSASYTSSSSGGSSGGGFSGGGGGGGFAGGR